MLRFGERDVTRYADEARAWMNADERRKVIGMVLLSVAISITLSLLMTAIVGTMVRRRARVPLDGLVPATELAEPADPAAKTATPVAVMDVPAPTTEAPGVPVEA